MGGFVRLRVFARRGDDEQFLRAVRDDLPRRPGRRAAKAALGLALLLAAILWMVTAPQILFDKLSQAPEGAVRQALVLGMAAGAAGAVFVLAGLRFIAEWAGGPVEDRMAKLLIEQHDKLLENADRSSDDGGQASPGPGETGRRDGPMGGESP